MPALGLSFLEKRLHCLPNIFLQDYVVEQGLYNDSLKGGVAIGVEVNIVLNIILCK